MMAHVAANTQRGVRAGSGGVMLPNHSAERGRTVFDAEACTRKNRFGDRARTRYRRKNRHALRRSWEVIMRTLFPINWKHSGVLGHDLRSDHPFAAIQANLILSLTPRYLHA